LEIHRGDQLAFARDCKNLPRIREVIADHMQGRGLTRDRVLAAALRLIDLGFFRSVRSSRRDDGTKTYVTYHVVEWPPVLVIRFSGNTLVDQRSLLREEAVEPALLGNDAESHLATSSA